MIDMKTFKSRPLTAAARTDARVQEADPPDYEVPMGGDADAYRNICTVTRCTGHGNIVGDVDAATRQSRRVTIKITDM